MCAKFGAFTQKCTIGPILRAMPPDYYVGLTERESVTAAKSNISRDRLCRPFS